MSARNKAVQSCSYVRDRYSQFITLIDQKQDFLFIFFSRSESVTVLVLYMAKNYQLVHILAQNKPSTIVYAGIKLSNRETITITVTDTDAIDNYQQIIVS